MRKWMPLTSAARPIIPPRASISRTSCPLATPPMAGLQLMRPIASKDCVTRSVSQPSRAEAEAASIPA